MLALTPWVADLLEDYSVGYENITNPDTSEPASGTIL